MSGLPSPLTSATVNWTPPVKRGAVRQEAGESRHRVALQREHPDFGGTVASRRGNNLVGPVAVQVRNGDSRAAHVVVPVGHEARQDNPVSLSTTLTACGVPGFLSGPRTKIGGYSCRSGIRYPCRSPGAPPEWARPSR